jgi:hypothetical protein
MKVDEHGEALDLVTERMILEMKIIKLEQYLAVLKRLKEVGKEVFIYLLGFGKYTKGTVRNSFLHQLSVASLLEIQMANFIQIA